MIKRNYKKEYKKRSKWFIKYNKERREIITKFIQSIKEAFPCADCNVYLSHYKMQFDHVKKKKFCIGSKGTASTSISTLLDEMAKCDIVCANCHSARTYFRNKGISSRGLGYGPVTTKTRVRIP